MPAEVEANKQRSRAASRLVVVVCRLLTAASGVITGVVVMIEAED